MPPYLNSFPLGPWFATQLLLIFCLMSCQSFLNGSRAAETLNLIQIERGSSPVQLAGLWQNSPVKYGGQRQMKASSRGKQVPPLWQGEEIIEPQGGPWYRSNSRSRSPAEISFAKFSPLTEMNWRAPSKGSSNPSSLWSTFSSGTPPMNKGSSKLS